MKHDDYYDKEFHNLEVTYKACLYCIIGITALLLLMMHKHLRLASITTQLLIQ